MDTYIPNDHVSSFEDEGRICLYNHSHGTEEIVVFNDTDDALIIGEVNLIESLLSFFIWLKEYYAPRYIKVTFGIDRYELVPYFEHFDVSYSNGSLCFNAEFPPVLPEEIHTLIPQIEGCPAFKLVCKGWNQVTQKIPYHPWYHKEDSTYWFRVHNKATWLEADINTVIINYKTLPYLEPIFKMLRINKGEFDLNLADDPNLLFMTLLKMHQLKLDWNIGTINTNSITITPHWDHKKPTLIYEIRVCVIWTHVNNSGIRILGEANRMEYLIKERLT
jgi:hypothetical protein